MASVHFEREICFIIFLRNLASYFLSIARNDAIHFTEPIHIVCVKAAERTLHHGTWFGNSYIQKRRISIVKISNILLG